MNSGNDADGDSIFTSREAAPADVYRLVQKPVHPQTTRHWLAMGAGGLLVLVVAVGLAGWWRNGADLKDFGVLFSPVVALVGTILGFYFSSKDRTG